jgi:hypothetical protein
MMSAFCVIIVLPAVSAAEDSTTCFLAREFEMTGFQIVDVIPVIVAALLLVTLLTIVLRRSRKPGVGSRPSLLERSALAIGIFLVMVSVALHGSWRALACLISGGILSIGSVALIRRA